MGTSLRHQSISQKFPLETWNLSEIWYNDLKQTLELSKFHIDGGSKHLKKLLKWLQLSNEMSTSRIFFLRGFTYRNPTCCTLLAKSLQKLLPEGNAHNCWYLQRTKTHTCNVLTSTAFSSSQTSFCLYIKAWKEGEHADSCFFSSFEWLFKIHC